MGAVLSCMFRKHEHDLLHTAYILSGMFDMRENREKVVLPVVVPTCPIRSMVHKRVGFLSIFHPTGERLALSAARKVATKNGRVLHVHALTRVTPIGSSS